MKRAIPITTLFLDIGDVLLTDGWDHHARRRASKHFKLEWAEMEHRHSLNVATHEEGKLTLEEYLSRVVFYQKRPFTQAQFRRFMCSQSKPYPEMLELVAQLKIRHRLKIVVVSNVTVHGSEARKNRRLQMLGRMLTAFFRRGAPVCHFLRFGKIQRPQKRGAFGIPPRSVLLYARPVNGYRSNCSTLQPSYRRHRPDASRHRFNPVNSSRSR